MIDISLRRALALGVAVPMCAASLLSQPVVEIAGGNPVRLGDLYEGAIGRKDLIVRNTGRDTLRITGVEPSCSCTVPVISRREIAPHDSAHLVVEFDSRGYEGDVVKDLTLISNDPVVPTLQIHLASTVSTLITIEPKALRFGAQKKGAVVKKTLVVTNTGSDSIRLLSVKVPEPLIRARIRGSVLAPKQSARLEFTFTAKRAGKFNSLVECYTDDKRQPVVKFPYYALVTP